MSFIFKINQQSEQTIKILRAYNTIAYRSIGKLTRQLNEKIRITSKINSTIEVQNKLSQ